jgi:hypothetical protein
VSGRTVYAYAGGNPITNTDPLGLLDSVTATCWTNAEICHEIFGQIAKNAAAMSGNPCLEEEADEFDRALGVAATIATVLPLASNIAGASNLVKQLENENQLAQVMGNQGKVMAGAGVQRQIDDIARIVQEYGGNVSDWTKVTSYAYKTPAGQIIAVHAYENLANGLVVEPKSVMNWF